MRILICNDDGHFSPGLATLERAAATISNDVWTVAPEGQRSSMGHSISLHAPFTLTRLSDKRYSCSGTPADCAIAAMAWLFADSEKPALVLSGINDGRNIGEDIAYSGTMSIAREASFWEIPALAFSSLNNTNFEAPGMMPWLSGLLQNLVRNMAAWHRPDEWLSINLPTTVPTSLQHAAPGRAKIAGGITAEVVDANTTLLRYLKGRKGEQAPGDEASLLDAGCATVYRLCWNRHSRIDDSLLDDINSINLKDAA